jgi:hypothetical protein
MRALQAAVQRHRKRRQMSARSFEYEPTYRIKIKHARIADVARTFRSASSAAERILCCSFPRFAESLL